MKILGIDPGIGICGFGLIEISDRAKANAKILDYGAAVVNTLASELNIPLYNHRDEKVQLILPDYGHPANITAPKK